MPKKLAAKKNILIIFFDLGLGGVQRRLVDIATYIFKNKPEYNIHIVLRNRKEFKFDQLLPKEFENLHYRSPFIVHRRLSNHYIHFSEHK